MVNGNDRSCHKYILIICIITTVLLVVRQFIIFDIQNTNDLQNAEWTVNVIKYMLRLLMVCNTHAIKKKIQAHKNKNLTFIPRSKGIVLSRYFKMSVRGFDTVRTVHP